MDLSMIETGQEFSSTSFGGGGGNGTSEVLSLSQHTCCSSNSSVIRSGVHEKSVVINRPHASSINGFLIIIVFEWTYLWLSD